MRLSTILATSIAVTFLSVPTLAQEDGRPDREQRQQRQRVQQLDPEKAEAAWNWQAKALGHEMDLGEAETEKLMEVYVASRTKMNDEVEKARQAARDARRAARESGEGDAAGEGTGGRGEGRGAGGRGGGAGGAGFGGRAGFGAVSPELLEEGRAGLATELEAILPEKDRRRAMSSLGLYSVQWDRMVDSVLGMELAEEKNFEALEPIREYVVDFAELRESGDRQAMRAGMTELTESLTDRLGAILDEDQMKKFRESMNPGRGQGRGGQGRGGQGRGGRDGGPPPSRDDA